MLKIRLSRIGKRNEPYFRVVVAQQRAPAKGKFVESLGFYNPQEKVFKIDEEKTKLWLSRGAKPSPTVHNKLVDLGIIKEPKIKVSKRKEKPAEAKPEAKPEAKS